MDVATIKRGRIVDSRRIPIDLPAEPTSWAKAVRTCGERLGEAIKEMMAEGARARIIYRSPTQTVDLASYDLRSPLQACAAAKLPAAESLRFSVASAVMEATAVGRDSSGDKKWHVVVAAERIDVVRAMVELAETAGLIFESATPMDAVTMARLVDRALKFKGPQHGWLHFGQHSSFFILAGEGRIRFERAIGVGIDAIEQGLTRPIRIPDESPITLDLPTVRKILHTHGIPEEDRVVSDDHRLTRQHMMPQIQPVLQRYVVELRQSLRFGLSDDERSSIEVTVSGPGSSVPGLSELIAWELKLNFTCDPQYADYEYTKAAAAGSELADAVGTSKFLESLNLEPPEASQRRQVGRLRRWMWSGAAAAVLLMGFDTLRLDSAVNDARTEHDTLKVAVHEQRTLAKTHQKIVAAISAMNELEALIDDEVGARANMRAILQELSRLTPHSVKLNSIRFNREDEALSARIYGRALEIDEVTQATEVQSFIEALKTSPLFRSASLRNVEKSQVVGSAAGGERFEATFEAILAPDINELTEMAGADDGGGKDGG